MAKTKTYSIGPVTGTGRTITEARKDAESKAARFMDRAQEGPIVLMAGEACSIVYACDDGATAVCRVDRDGIVSRTWTEPYSDLEKAARSCALQMAYQTWHGEDDPHPKLSWRFQDHEWSEWRSWVRFQRAHKKARQMGMSDHDAHTYAGGFTQFLSTDAQAILAAQMLSTS